VVQVLLEAANTEQAEDMTLIVGIPALRPTALRPKAQSGFTTNCIRRLYAQNMLCTA
jgi:hypothetical protein